MYGNLTLEEFAEENGYDNHCGIDCVEEYNENIEEHLDTLEDNDGKIFEV